MIIDVLLGLLKAGLDQSNNIDDILLYIAKFSLTNKQYHNFSTSLLGEKIIKETLLNLTLHPEDLDQHLIACFKNKNLFMFKLFLSLPNANPNLVVSEKNKIFLRPSIIDSSEDRVSDENQGSPLSQFEIIEWPKVIPLILDSDKVSDNNQRLSPLLHFAIKMWPEVVALLLDAGVQVHAQDYYPKVVSKFCRYVLTSNYYEFFLGGLSPLHVAAIVNNTDLIHFLVKKGASVNSIDEKGRTPLHLATIYDNSEAIDCLIENKANKESFYLCPTKEKNTPLILAISCRHEKAVAALLKNGCSLNYDYDQLIKLAVSKGQLGLIKKLIELEPRLIDKEIKNINKGLRIYNSNFEMSKFIGLLETYPYSEVKKRRLGQDTYLQFIQELILLTKDKNTQNAIKESALLFTLEQSHYTATVELLGLEAKNGPHELLTDKGWLSLLSRENALTSLALLHQVATHLAYDLNFKNTFLVFNYLLSKAQEVAYDFSQKSKGLTIYQTVQKQYLKAPNELKEKLFYLEQNSFRQNLVNKINVAILGKNEIKDSRTELPLDDKKSYLGWMNRKATGTRGFNRFSHWYHGDSGVKRARDLLNIVNNPNTSYEEILEKLRKTFKESSCHQHSLSRYLVAQFDKKDFAKIKTLGDDDFASIKTGFKFA